MPQKSRNISSLFLLCSWSFGLFFSSFALASPGDGKVLAIGEQVQLDLPDGSRFSVGNPEVIQVKLLPKTKDGEGGLLIKGKSQGYSDLWIFPPEKQPKSFDFRVVTKKQATLVADSEKIISFGKDLKMEPLAGGWLVTGKAKRLEEWQKMQAVRSQAKGGFQGLMEIHPMERLKAESKIQRLFRQANLRQLEVRGVGNYIVLEGSCDSKEQKLFAESLASQVFQPIQSFLEVPFEKAVTFRYRAKILEIKRSSAHQFGIRWNQSGPAAISFSKSFTKAGFSWAAALDFLEKNGGARVLSQPELLLNEKGIAELKVGGEIPISLVSKESANVQWKPYGLHVRIEAPGSSKKKTRTKISVEISSLDPNTGINQMPGIRLSKMETVVDLKHGEPVLLSGLMDSRQSKLSDQLPFLADIPILGALFQSEDFRSDRSELLLAIEVTPEGK